MHTLPDLPYPYNALEPYIDEMTMRIHHDKHHAAYVKNLNDALAGQENLSTKSAEELIRTLNTVPEAIRTKVRNNAGGHFNHSLFWLGMAPHAGGEPKGELGKAITKSFGGFDKFQLAFESAAMGRFGSGWAWLVADGAGVLSITDSPNQDSPFTEAGPAGTQAKTPVLALDVWEHAYYLKYQNLRAEYIKNWWYVVNWPEAEKQFARKP